MIQFWGADGDRDAQGRIKGKAPIAVLDIGSNSVRLVVYERHARALTPLYNEKASCALGRGVAATGRLNDDNVAQALKAMRRFALVVKLMKVGRLHILATSAVREAENGPEFAEEVKKIVGADVQVLSGMDEAYYAALGVGAGISDFSGIVGDLGGGSLELSAYPVVDRADGETLGLGVIRLQDDSEKSPRAAMKLAGERLKKSKVLPKNESKTFCAIGGTWRALAKLHQKVSGYPLRMVQDYEVDADDLLELCNSIISGAEDNDGEYPNIDRVSSSRRHLLPFGAAVLKEVIKIGKFERVVFSALGVREGFLYGELAENEQALDPLMQLCGDMSVLRSRSPTHSSELIEFTRQFIVATDLPESASEARLREAACLLADIGWRGHPDYRGEQSVDLVAYGALVGVDHPGRAFLSETLAVRYMGTKHKSISSGLLALAGQEANERARILGALFRVAFPMSAGMSGVLPKVSFNRSGDILELILPTELAFLEGSRLNSRLAQLATAIPLENSAVRIL